MNKQAKIILFSCLYMTGILAALLNCTIAICAVVVIFLCILQIIKKPFSLKYFLCLFGIFFVGLVNANSHLSFDDELTAFSDNNVTVKAKVISIPSNSVKNKTKFYAQTQSIKFDDIEEEGFDVKTLITINDETERLSQIKIGDVLELKGRLKTPSKAANPSQFDYAKYLQYKNTFSLLYVNSDWDIVSRATDFKGRLIRKLNDTRNSILNIHRENIQSPMIEILGGIIFGDDAVNPDEETKESFIKSGIFHILAASGMNVTLIFGIWFFFAKNLRFNYRFSILAGIALIFVYTCMTGFGPPIIRAFLMLTLILIGKLIDKDTSTISLLFIVGFLMLLYNPLMIFDIGFQLSFIVTFALILTAPLIDFKFKNKPLNYALGACMIPVIAQIYAAPLQMFYFNTFSIYSVFANIAIIPVLSLVSFIGFISSILALVPILANKICYLADLILNPFLIYIVKVAEFFASLPFSVVTVAKPHLIQLVIYFLFVIGLTIALKNKIKTKKTMIFLSSLILLFIFTLFPLSRNSVEVLFFSVGNADATLIKSPQNKYYILDTGKMPYNAGSSQANYIIIKYLKDKGIKKIDGLILSHFDADHAGGTIDILKQLDVENVYISNSYEDTMLSSSIIDFLEKKKVKSTIVDSELIVDNSDEFKLKIIKPNGENLIDENDKSIVSLMEYGDEKILFMGDGGVKTFDVLPATYKEDISIIKVGHHGAKDTLSEKIKSDLYIVSTGFNVYGHPHSQTMDFLKDKVYLRTDFHNAIKVIVKDKINIFVYSPETNSFKQY